MPVTVNEPAAVTCTVRVEPVRVSVTLTLASVAGAPPGVVTLTLMDAVVTCANPAAGTIRNNKKIRKVIEARNLVFILLSTCKSSEIVKFQGVRMRHDYSHRTASKKLDSFRWKSHAPAITVSFTPLP